MACAYRRFGYRVSCGVPDWWGLFVSRATSRSIVNGWLLPRIHTSSCLSACDCGVSIKTHAERSLLQSSCLNIPGTLAQQWSKLRQWTTCWEDYWLSRAKLFRGPFLEDKSEENINFDVKWWRQKNKKSNELVHKLYCPTQSV